MKTWTQRTSRLPMYKDGEHILKIMASWSELPIEEDGPPIPGSFVTRSMPHAHWLMTIAGMELLSGAKAQALLHHDVGQEILPFMDRVRWSEQQYQNQLRNWVCLFSTPRGSCEKKTPQSLAKKSVG